MNKSINKNNTYSNNKQIRRDFNNNSSKFDCDYIKFKITVNTLMQTDTSKTI